jgi:ubiquinone/menaquinone biosynthesis C-methylase UbiE
MEIRMFIPVDLDTTQFTQRQLREIEYHREHAKEYQRLLKRPFSYDVLVSPQRRWWNPYWEMFGYLRQCDLKDKNLLVVGCGFGEDALRCAKLGARVHAFDLSSDSLRIATALAKREGLDIEFRRMPAEKLVYEDNYFDFIVARDILHHVDIPQSMAEIVRVAKPGATFVVDEIYSHSLTDSIRRSKLVEKILYPALQKFVYAGNRPYITVDERKLSERDIRLITASVSNLAFKKYFNFIVTRLIPDEYEPINKLDRMLMAVLHPIARFLAGRILFAGVVQK